MGTKILQICPSQQPFPYPEEVLAGQQRRDAETRRLVLPDDVVTGGAGGQHLRNGRRHVSLAQAVVSAGVVQTHYRRPWQLRGYKVEKVT